MSVPAGQSTPERRIEILPYDPLTRDVCEWIWRCSCGCKSQSFVSPETAAAAARRHSCPTDLERGSMEAYPPPKPFERVPTTLERAARVIAQLAVEVLDAEREETGVDEWDESDPRCFLMNAAYAVIEGRPQDALTYETPEEQ